MSVDKVCKTKLNHTPLTRKCHKSKIMYYKIKSLLLTLTFVFLMSTFIYGQFSRNDAIDLVLNTLLANDIGEVDVYASNNSFTTDVELIDNDSPSNPNSESWVFFSDDKPFTS